MVTIMQLSLGCIICGPAFPITTQEIKLRYSRSQRHRQALIMAVIADLERITPDPGQQHTDAALMLCNVDGSSSAGQHQRLCRGEVLKQSQLL
jgi:hypothetical protein